MIKVLFLVIFAAILWHVFGEDPDEMIFLCCVAIVGGFAIAMPTGSLHDR